MCTFEYVAHFWEFFREVICKNGKKQTLITQSKVAEDSDKRTDLDTLPTSYVFKNSYDCFNSYYCEKTRFLVNPYQNQADANADLNVSNYKRVFAGNYKSVSK